MSEWDALLRLGLAAVLGASIGLEREISGKEAGLRTTMLVSMGAAIFATIALLLVDELQYDAGGFRIDPTRIIGETIGGIGFLGGAIVFRGRNHVEGVTTAAAIWTATGIGLASGIGLFILAIGGTGIVLFTLYGVRWIQNLVGLKPSPPATILEHIDEVE